MGLDIHHLRFALDKPLCRQCRGYHLSPLDVCLAVEETRQTSSYSVVHLSDHSTQLYADQCPFGASDFLASTHLILLGVSGLQIASSAQDMAEVRNWHRSSSE